MAVTTEARTATVSVTVGDQELTFETGKLAKQADGAVVVRAGETMVLATATGKMEAREGADFFPLTVDVEERMYAAGKIPGGFFKREGRPTERAILTARMIDRPIRPLWPKGFKNEVQVICTVLSADMVTAHDILCINGASAALMISPLPFLGPVGAVRIGRIDGKLVINPTLREMEDEASLELIVVGTKGGLTMVEAGGGQIAEATMLGDRENAPALWMDSTDQDITRQVQVRAALQSLLEKQRSVAVEGPLLEQFGDELRALTDAEQDSKQLKSAKRQLLFERMLEEVRLPFP